MSSATARNIAIATHGRYLVRAAAAAPAPLLIGFHGYAESADLQMERLALTPGTDGWTLVSIQGLHRFYRRRSDEVVASWMTRQDRDLMIADNAAYVGAVIDEVSASAGAGPAMVFAGFSQGVSMAFRAASGWRAPAGLVACAGDVPPELDADKLRRLPRVLIGRGAEDRVYPAEMMARDAQRLTAAGVEVDASTVGGGHEWSQEFAAVVGRFLAELRR